VDIYDFFNSPDVADYCRSLGHSFNSVESAVMINKSNYRTLTEKHAAYRTIIAEYPDMEILDNLHNEPIESFHKSLEEAIIHDEFLLAEFLKPETGTVYQVKITYSGRSSSYWGNYEELFTSYEDAVTEIKKAHELESEEEVPSTISSHIKKNYIGSRDYLYAEVSPTGEVIRLYADCMPSRELYNKQIDTSNFLDSFYINVPVPFKPGDLVEDLSGDFRGFMGSVYVLRNISNEQPGSDTSDTVAWVYYEADGSIECECMHFYPDLQYCRKELDGEARILEYVSLYKQDKLCLCHLLRVQRFLVGDKITGQLTSCWDNDFQPIIEKLTGKH